MEKRGFSSHLTIKKQEMRRTFPVFCSVLVLYEVAVSSVDGSLCVPFGDGVALIVEFFALGDGEFHFYPTVLKIEPKRDEAVALRLCKSAEFLYLTLMQKQFPLAERIAVEDITHFVRTYVHTYDERLSVFDLGICVLYVHLAHTDAFDLGADEHEAAFIGGFDEVFVPRLAVFGKLFFAAFYWHIRDFLKTFLIIFIAKNAAPDGAGAARRSIISTFRP